MGVPWYAHLFREEPDEPAFDTAVLGKAQNVLDFAAAVYYKEFESWLEEGAYRKIAVSGNHLEMAAEIARQNTFKEVRDHLRRKISEANRTVAHSREIADDRT